MFKKTLSLITMAAVAMGIAFAQSTVPFSFTNTDGVVYSCSGNMTAHTAFINGVTLNGVSNVVIPDTVTYGGAGYRVVEIGYGAFSGELVENITVPSGVVEIGYEAFYDCADLQSVTLNCDSLYIWDEAFSTCPRLKTFNFNCRVSDGYLFSDYTPFYGCDSLATLNIGPNVRSLLLTEIFDELSALRTINISAPVLLAISSSFFWHHGTPISINVPCSLYSAYSSDASWSALGTVQNTCPSGFALTVLSNNNSLGTAWGSDTVAAGDTVRIYATPVGGNLFHGWDDSVSANPRMVVVDSNITLTAIFAQPAPPVTLHDTLYLTDTLYLHDTLNLHDTLYLTDTLYLHDTIYVHDTVYTGGPDAITDAIGRNFKIFASMGDIVVEGPAGEMIRLYDISGRMLLAKQLTAAPMRMPVPKNGTYLVQIGNSHARKIVIKK